MPPAWRRLGNGNPPHRRDPPMSMLLAAAASISATASAVSTNASATDAGGLAKLVATTVPDILSSTAFQTDGMLIITFDEAELIGDHADSSACCNTPRSPNAPNPGLAGPGGGRIGALVLAANVAPASVNATPYNHYSLLCSIEDIFDLPHLGFAGAPGLACFGNDVYGN